MHSHADECLSWRWKNQNLFSEREKRLLQVVRVQFQQFNIPIIWTFLFSFSFPFSFYFSPLLLGFRFFQMIHSKSRLPNFTSYGLSNQIRPIFYSSLLELPFCFIFLYFPTSTFSLSFFLSFLPSFPSSWPLHPKYASLCQCVHVDVDVFSFVLLRQKQYCKSRDRKWEEREKLPNGVNVSARWKLNSCLPFELVFLCSLRLSFSLGPFSLLKVTFLFVYLRVTTRCVHKSLSLLSLFPPLISSPLSHSSLSVEG